jgi:hypothetical protein
LNGHNFFSLTYPIHTARGQSILYLAARSIQQTYLKHKHYQGKSVPRKRLLYLHVKHVSVSSVDIFISLFNFRFLLLLRLVRNYREVDVMTHIYYCHYYKLWRKWVRTIHSEKRHPIRKLIKCCEGEGSEVKLLIPLGKAVEKASRFYKVRQCKN